MATITEPTRKPKALGVCAPTTFRYSESKHPSVIPSSARSNLGLSHLKVGRLSTSHLADFVFLDLPTTPPYEVFS